MIFKVNELMAKKSRIDGVKCTYRKIYKSTGISPNTLSRLAQGKTNGTGDTIETLLKYFDCEPNDLVEREYNDQGKNSRNE